MEETQDSNSSPFSVHKFTALSTCMIVMKWCVVRNVVPLHKLTFYLHTNITCILSYLYIYNYAA